MNSLIRQLPEFRERLWRVGALKSINFLTLFCFLSFLLSTVSAQRTQDGLVDNVTTRTSDNKWQTVQEGSVIVDGTKVNYSLGALPRSLAAAGDIDQIRNGGAESRVNPPNWVNGNANETQAHYAEGYSIGYRLKLTDLTLGTHTINIEWDIMGSSGVKHAIDYITHYQNMDNPAGSHLATYGHAPEAVDPTIDIPGLGAPNTFPIPPPTSVGSPIAGMPTTSFNALGNNEFGANLKNFTIYNGTITSLTYGPQGSLTDDGSQQSLTIVINATSPTVVLAWGGHIASQTDWGFGNSASAINGAPYHTRFLDLDGSGGNQDRALMASAVFVLPDCNVSGPTAACPGQSLCFTANTNFSTTSTGYTWSIVDNTAGASIFSGAASGTVPANTTTVPGICVKATQGGSYTVKLTVTRLSPTGILTTHDCYSQPVTVTNLAINGDVIASEADAEDSDGIKPIAGDANCPTQYEINLLKANAVHFTASGASTLSWALVPDGNPLDNVSFTDNGDGTATFTINSYVGASDVYKFIVTGTDANGCTGKDSVCIVPTTILPPCNLCGPAIVCSGTQEDQVYSLKSLCANANPDDISGSLEDFNYVWTITNVTGGGSVDFVGASTNVNQVTTRITGTVTSYTVQLNINGKGPLSINVPPCTITTTVGDIAATDAHVDVKCYGGSDGSVTVTFSGGTAPYQVNFNGGGFVTETSPKTYSGLVAGDYTWVVRDANGCTEAGSETVDQPTDLVANDGHVDVKCYGGSDGSVTLTFSGGTAPYQVSFNGGGFVTETSPKTYSGLAAANYTWVVRDANGCTEAGSEMVGKPVAISCALVAPTTNPTCSSTGNLVGGSITGGTGTITCSASFDATGVSAGWSVTNCAVAGSSILVTYTAGTSASTVLTVVVTDANGCTSQCTVTLTCAMGGKGCTPGFWKNHPNVWDKTTDFVVNNMPGTLASPVTKGETFVTTTNFYSYFNIPVGTCGLPKNANLTMLQATGTGGGNCNALARHGVSALLGAAAFPGEYPYPAGMNNFTDLYNAIRNAFLTCNCGPLHLKLAAINELDGEFCGALQKLPQIGNPSSIPSKLKVTDVFVKAYPNPYSTEINFSLVSPVSGQGLLEVYDVVGRKIAVVYQGRVDANISRTVKYLVPATLRETLIYKFTVDGSTAVGKLMPGDKSSPTYQP